MPDPKPDLTHLLRRIHEGDDHAKATFVEIVYDELRRLARFEMNREREGHTLQPTALVNEALIRLLSGTKVEWESSTHFFCVAARTMRRILTDHARQVNSKKRAGGLRICLDDQVLFMDPRRADSYLELESALHRLEAISPRLSQVVELKFFGGLTFEQIALVMGVKSRTVKRDWIKARTWLHAAMSEVAEGDKNKTSVGPRQRLL